VPRRLPDLSSLGVALPPGLRRILPPILLLAGVAAGGLWLYDQHQTRAEEARAQALEESASALARDIAALLKAPLEAVDILVRDPLLLAALSDGQPTEALENRLASAIPGALRVRLIRRGQMQTDPAANPPFTYASLDLLLKAERGPGASGIEVHAAGTPEEHLELARRLPAEGTVEGFLHVSLDAGALREKLPALLTRQEVASATVQQSMNGVPPIVVARIGAPGSGTEVRINRPIAGTAWQLVLEPRDGRIEVDYLRLVVLPMLVLLLLGLLVMEYRARRARAVQQAPAIAPAPPRPAQAASAVAQVPPVLAADESVRAETPLPPPETGADSLPAFEPPSPESEASAPAGVIAPGIFRSYDIRGVVGETLTADAVRLIGLAFGAEAAARGQKMVVVGRDGRHTSPELHAALVDGLRAVGRDVLDVGMVPSPVLYFASQYLATRTGVMVTGSHNPPEYNGLKLVLDGETLSGEAIQAIRRRIERGDWEELGRGDLQEMEIVPDYIRRVTEDIPVSLTSAFKIVVDCGNAVPGKIVPDILRALGHDVIELFCEVDGDFPNHHPDPSQPENLSDLIAMVAHEQADLGLAFDGDGDRLGVVDSAGGILWPDRQMMLFARHILKRHPGSKVVFDVKCSHLLAEDIRQAGGEPIMARSGHSLIRHTMQECGALLAGDLSGHLFFKDRWYGFDDAIYAAARLIEIIVDSGESSAEIFARLPAAHSTPELRVDLPEDQHAAFMQRLRTALDFPDGRLTEIDGIRVDFKDSWGLIRPSNTTPCLTLRFEGSDEGALALVQDRFRNLLHTVSPGLHLPF